jgi:hypothetical protein
MEMNCCNKVGIDAPASLGEALSIGAAEGEMPKQETAFGSDADRRAHEFAGQKGSVA